jgi:putative ABC transport system permease protein
MGQGVDTMDTFIQDIRYGIRTLLKTPGFTVVAIIVLSLGIGANTAIFSVVNSVLLRPLHFNDPGRLVQIWESKPTRPLAEIPASYPNFADWRAQNQVFEHVVAYADWNFNLSGVSEPERLQGAIVSPAFFTMLGIKPIAGRVFSLDEDQPGKDLVVILSRRLWQRRFNSDPNIIGKTVNLGDDAFTVVGVVPHGAGQPLQSEEVEFWAPVSRGVALTNRFGHYLSVIGSLKPGATTQQAQADMDAIATRLEQQFPASNTGHRVKIISLQEQVAGNFRSSLFLLLAAVAFVLLIACANVAHMLLARGAARQKEIAIRSALGSSRSQLVRQMLTESLLLSFIGAVVGLLIAFWGIDFLVALSPADLPRVNEVMIDGRALGFTLTVSVLTGLAFGLIPALHGSRPNLNEILKDGGRGAIAGQGRQRARSFLVVSEIALSVVLLVGAGLLIRSLLRLQSVNPGFNSKNVLTMRLDLTGQKAKTGTKAILFHNQLLDRINGVPGIVSASTRSFVPITNDWAYLSFAIEGRPVDAADRPVGYYNAISPNYFKTMQIPLKKGREFDERDVRGAQNVIIINETMAHRYFPNDDPIGKRITQDDVDFAPDSWVTIVGIVGDTKPKTLDGEPVAEYYMPFAQQPEPSMSLMVRTSGDPGVAAAIRSEVLALDKDQPVYSAKTLDSLLSESVAKPRFRTILLGIFATLALLLSGVGIYGVMSYAVTRSTREIGIRLALGAQVRDVLKLVLRNGMKLALIGVGIGLAGAFAVTRLMSKLLFGVTATDAVTFGSVSVVLLAVAFLACYIPARRATKVDPLVALRYE